MTPPIAKKNIHKKIVKELNDLTERLLSLIHQGYGSLLTDIRGLNTRIIAERNTVEDGKWAMRMSHGPTIKAFAEEVTEFEKRVAAQPKRVKKLTQPALF